MKTLLLPAMGTAMLLSLTILGGPVISETDFSRNGKIMHVDYRTKGFGTFDGFLPKNWHENAAAWKKSETKTEIVKDPGGDYLKFTISGNGSQYFSKLPKLKKNTFYRLTATIRNKTGRNASVLLRAGKPYKVWTTMAIPGSDDWKTYTKTFQFEQEPDPSIALFLLINGNGEIDVRNIRLEEAK